MNLARKLIASHLAEGTMTPGSEIAIRIEQTLASDATGMLVALALDSLGVERTATELSVQYVDHNILQNNEYNAGDHRFLRSAARRFGMWYSGPGNGVSHPVHQHRFGRPGASLLGADSHTPAAGSLGMLAIGAGGLDVALAMAGEPFRLRMPEVWGVRLVGDLPDWVSAKDVVLEMLRRHGVDAATNCIFEYYGPGLERLSAMDRHVIANMGTELGATSTVFPSDAEVKRFLEAQGRGDAWLELQADRHDYDRHEEIDLGSLEPLIAKPPSPGNVVPVREVAGEPIYQAYIGSSANPGFADFAVAADIVRGRTTAAQVSFDVNPTSRQLLAELADSGDLLALIQAGARIHQAGCNGCLGMGQAPASHEISLRTVPRNFPSRSGTADDLVYLVSPETAAASALTGRITDPRDLDMPYPGRRGAPSGMVHRNLFVEPVANTEASVATLEMPGHVAPLPEFEPLRDTVEVPILLTLGDDVSTDEILRGGADVLPLWSNVERVAAFAFDVLDETYAERARAETGHAVVAGRNYGQGSSREHAALIPRYLGMRVVLAEGFARIAAQNLVNFGVLPLTIATAVRNRLDVGDTVRITNVVDQLRRGGPVEFETNEQTFVARHDLSPRQVDIVCAGGLVNHIRSMSGTRSKQRKRRREPNGDLEGTPLVNRLRSPRRRPE